MDIAQLKNLLRHYNLKPNFTYGQNFLIDDIVLHGIVDAADITSDDVILEIGPGIGNLTRLLCERAGFVLSIEKDPKFFPILKSIKKDFKKNFRFEIADALEFDYQEALVNTGQRAVGSGGTRGSDHSSLTTGHLSYKVVANIPYYITGKILRMLLSAKNKPAYITILTQKEVAQNIVAKAGNLSVLAISVQLYGRAEIVKTIPAKSFYPSPKVDSAVLRIAPYPKSLYQVPDEKHFFRIVKACFAGKRKQLHNTLKNNLGLSAQLVAKILLELKIKPAARPQELTIEQWIELDDKIFNLKI